MRVASLLRLSTKKQAKKQGKGDLDVPSQRQEIAKFLATRPEWQLVREFVEAGVSAFSNSAEERDILQDAMNEARKGSFDILLMWKGDRLSRQVDEVPSIVKRLTGWGVQVWSVADAPGGKQWTAGNAMELLMLALEGFKNQTYSEAISINVKTRMRQLVGEGKWAGGRIPFGYTLVPVEENGKQVVRGDKVIRELRPHPQHASTVVEMYRRYLQGFGFVAIAQWLNELGVPTLFGAPWRLSTVRQVLTNPTYKGSLVWGDVEAEGMHPAIVSPDMWQAVQNIKAEKGKLAIRQRTEDYPLTGVLVCARCGEKMGGHVRTQRSKVSGKTWTHRFYVCLGYAHRRGCVSKMLRADRVEAQFVRLVSSLGQPGGLREIIEERNSRYRERLEQYEGECRRLREIVRVRQQAIDRAKKAFLEEQVISAEEYRALKGEYDEKRAQAEEGLRNPPPKNEGLNLEAELARVESIEKVWPWWTVGERKMFALSICGALRVSIAVGEEMYFTSRSTNVLKNS